MSCRRFSIFILIFSNFSFLLGSQGTGQPKASSQMGASASVVRVAQQGKMLLCRAARPDKPTGYESKVSTDLKRMSCESRTSTDDVAITIQTVPYDEKRKSAKQILLHSGLTDLIADSSGLPYEVCSIVYQYNLPKEKLLPAISRFGLRQTKELIYRHINKVRSDLQKVNAENKARYGKPYIICQSGEGGYNPVYYFNTNFEQVTKPTAEVTPQPGNFAIIGWSDDETSVVLHSADQTELDRLSYNQMIVLEKLYDSTNLDHEGDRAILSPEEEKIFGSLSRIMQRNAGEDVVPQLIEGETTAQKCLGPCRAAACASLIFSPLIVPIVLWYTNILS